MTASEASAASASVKAGNRSTTLVVSPHLDDAVLSLGGAIATWSDVTIATVYTTGPIFDEIAPELRKWGDYATRLQEDIAACEAIGAERTWLGHMERVWRAPLPPMGYFITPDERAGFTELPAIVASLDVLGDFDRVFAPLGIGNHVDHVEAMLATIEWATRRGIADRLRFYEDFYGLSERLRAAHPIARRWTWEHSLVAGQLADMMNAIDVARRGPPLEALWPPLAEDVAWTVEPTAIDEDKHLAAIACYGSQTVAFGGMPGIAAAIRAYHGFWGGEPVWRLSV